MITRGPSRLSIARLVLLFLSVASLVCAKHGFGGFFGGSDHAHAAAHRHEARATTTSTWWLPNVKRQGLPAYGMNSSYVVYRNVKDYGALGDGVTDDTAALNKAISDGNRCGSGCDSTTITPAIIYFPPGTYMVSSPVIMYYYTQLIGDLHNLPVIKGLPNFFGIGLLDSDVYYSGGSNWWTNQNNFFRQVRNFVLDLTGMPANYGAGIHWQVAQATSLYNIIFNMRVGGTNNKQQGIFMDNGSGNFAGADLVFNGGHIGAFVGNQQFTVRNWTFNFCQIAIYQNWGWNWEYKSLSVNNCPIGIDMSNGGSVQTVGAIIVQDSVFKNVSTAIVTSWSNSTTPVSGGTLVVDNVDFTGAQKAIAYPNGTLVLAGGSIIPSFLQGRVYSTVMQQDTVGNLTCYTPSADSARIQRRVDPAPKPAALLDANGKIVEKSKPQWSDVPASSFISMKSAGAKGDGVTDDTAIIQRVFNAWQPGQVIYFDHGAYVVSNTIQVPKSITITGEIWPLIMALGTAFNDANNPKPVLRIGQPGDVGDVVITDMIFETIGPAPGAIMVEWNVAGTTPGSAGMWDVHWRIGGSAGTQLQGSSCSKTPSQQTSPNPNCVGSFLLLHITSSASLLMENNWGWVADHELDQSGQGQINIYNGRGLLVESTKGIWLYGNAMEHSTLYSYNIVNAANVYMSTIQSETAYFQDNPNALVPFPPSTTYNDPSFANCFQPICFKTRALNIANSQNIFIYGSGLYSFFNNYDQGCLITENCDETMVTVVNSYNVYLYSLSTKAAKNMVAVDGVAIVPEGANTNTFCQTVALFEEGSIPDSYFMNSTTS